VFCTDEQQHWYDCPYQVGTNSTDTPVQDATSHVVQLLPSDIIVIATDGLGDNLWDEEILAEAAGIAESGQIEFPKRSVQDIANSLCKRARAVGEDKWGESPYMVVSCYGS
jgi:protein phosphatase PTC7